MSTNEERRAEARKRLRDEMAAQKKRERNTTIATVAIAAVVVLGLVIWGVSYKVSDLNREKHLAQQQDELRAYNADWAACPYGPDQQKPEPVTDDQMASLDDSQKAQAKEYNQSIKDMAGKEKTATPPDGDQYRRGTVDITLTTNSGDIPMTLDRDGAPCNVASFEGLVKQSYYNNTICHRLTKTSKEAQAAGQGLNVLQCGDPTGTGLGGPGYTVVDENPTALKPGPDGQSAVYPAGTVAMAKSQSPNSAGSQFFLVYDDSMLPPNYSVLGKVDDAGLKVLKKIADGGTKSDDANSPDSQKPKNEVDIKTATVTKEDPVPERPEKPDVELPEDQGAAPGGAAPAGAAPVGATP